MRLPFLNRDDETVSANPKQDMRFFLHSKRESVSSSTTPKVDSNQLTTNKQPAHAVTTTAASAATKRSAPERPVRVEREPDTVRMQVPQGFSSMESAISFQLAYERGMSNAANLKLVEDEFNAARTAINATGKQSGYNPYESGYLSRKKSAGSARKSTDLRALSKWIEQKRK